MGVITDVKQNGTQDERRAKPGNRYEMWDMYIAVIASEGVMPNADIT